MLWACRWWWDTISCSPHSLERDSLSETLMNTEDPLSQRKGTTVEPQAEPYTCPTNLNSLLHTSTEIHIDRLDSREWNAQRVSCLWPKHADKNLQFKDAHLSRQVIHSLVRCFLKKSCRRCLVGVDVFCRPARNGDDERRRQRWSFRPDTMWSGGYIIEHLRLSR